LPINQRYELLRETLPGERPQTSTRTTTKNDWSDFRRHVDILYE
jgi:hypothetical protein